MVAMTSMDSLVAAISLLSTASLHEAAGKTGALPSYLKPLSPETRVCGRALPVRCPGGDNLWLHRAIYTAAPGEVLVVDTGNVIEYGYWGEVMALAAQERKIAGLVITGGVRDSRRLLEMGFAVFCATVCIRGTRKDPHSIGSIGTPILLNDVPVHHADVVLGDADGVVVLPADEAAQIAVEARSRDAAEQEVFRRLRCGATTVEIYGLPDLAP
jgi:4-hydroxy-4-methyl-2-oxoglutarate aldolase